MSRLVLQPLVWTLLGMVVGCGSLAEAQTPATRDTGPWDMATLRAAPQAEWGKPSGVVREVWYDNVPLAGKPTRVFAYYARPNQGDGPFPAMLLVHGGGGKAFRQWAELWAERGYVALAMDLAGKGPDGKRHEHAGPDQDDNGKFRDFSNKEVDQMWTFHAVAAVVRGHSLLAERPEVDRQRIGVTGISWGGYLTCILAGVDDRLKLAVPVYGCGFLGDNSAWLERLAKMPEAQRARWLRTFDPSRYLPGATCPMLFVNGTNDFAYPLDSYQKSYRLPRGPVSLCVRVNMPHGHTPGWAPVEIGLFADSVFTGGKPLPRVGDVVESNGVATLPLVPGVPKGEYHLHYTTDGGPWQKRRWQSVAATVKESHASSALPTARPLVYYFTLTDERGALVSTPHVERP